MKVFRKISYILVIAILAVSIFASTGIVRAATEWFITFTVVYADGSVDSGTSDKKDDFTTSYATYHLSCSEDLLVNPGVSTSGVQIVSYNITIKKDGVLFETCGGTAPTPTPPTPTEPTPTEPTPTEPTPTEPTPTEPTPTEPTPTEPPTTETPTPTGTPGILIPVTGGADGSISIIWAAFLIVLIIMGTIKVTKKI